MIDHEDNPIDVTSRNAGGEPAFRTPKVKNFRTLQDDLIHAVKKQDHSIAKVVLSAREKVWRERAEREKYKDLEVEQVKMRFALRILVLPVVFLFVFFVLQFATNKSLLFFTAEKVGVAPNSSLQPTKEIFIETSKLDKQSFATTFKKIKTRTVPQDRAFFKISLMKGGDQLSSAKFLELWTNPTIAEKGSVVFNNSYSLGFYSSKGKLFSFVQFLYENKKDINALMSSWENTLYTDTRILFVKEGIVSDPFFKDAVASSTPFRIIEFRAQDPAILYAKLNNNMLVITEDDVVLNML